MEGSSRDLLISGIVGENVYIYKQNGFIKKVRKDFFLYYNNQKIYLFGVKILNQSNYKYLYIVYVYYRFYILY